MKIENSIGWCDATTNAVTGCDKVSPGCKNCYAEAGTRARVLRATGIETWGAKGVRHPVNFEQVFSRLNKLCVCGSCHEANPVSELVSGRCSKCGRGDLRRIRLFADSNSDWLDRKWRIKTLAKFLDAIRLAPNVDVLLLTKRIENFKDRLHEVNFAHDEACDLTEMVSEWINGHAPKNVWLGVSVENQEYADKRIPELLRVPAAVRFLSCEPLLGRVDLTFPGGGQADTPYNLRGNFWKVACENHCTFKGREDDLIPDPDQSVAEAEENGTDYVCPTCHCSSALVYRDESDPAIDWLIVGSESGKNRRDCGVEAIVSVAEQCVAAGVPVFVKQDCAFKSGQQGRIPDNVWNLKQFPHAKR